MKKNVIILVLAVILLISLLTACNGVKVQGKYYKENSDGTLDDSSWIELMKQNKWQDDEGAAIYLEFYLPYPNLGGQWFTFDIYYLG